jgi:hypothetical protein
LKFLSATHDGDLTTGRQGAISDKGFMKGRNTRPEASASRNEARCVGVFGRLDGYELSFGEAFLASSENLF